MDYKKSRRLLHICLIGGLAVYLPGYTMGADWTIIVFIAATLVGVIQYFKFGRCPHCGTLFNTRVRLPRHCPECGKELE